MKCPKCGKPNYKPPKHGRPRKLNDDKVGLLYIKGNSYGELAEFFGVTRGAIQASLKRSTSR